MIVKKIKHHFPYILTGLWIFLLSSLGLWWLYLIVHLGEEIQRLEQQLPQTSHATNSAINFVELAKWEGSTFLLLLGLVSFFLVFIYLQDLKKAKAMQAFFASLTHELKTPLASMRLQSEVIGDLVKDQAGPSSTQLIDLTNRLVEDSHKLEHELEKILQLSRIERGAKLHLECFDLFELTQKILKKEIHAYSSFLNTPPLTYQLTRENESGPISPYRAEVDDHALRMILRNLVENTYKYAANHSLHLKFLVRADHKIVIDYQDGGGEFQGEVKRLGQLFYTYQGKMKKELPMGQHGSGIGLYLISKLMEKMNGQLVIKSNPTLHFELIFPQVQTPEEQ